MSTPIHRLVDGGAPVPPYPQPPVANSSKIFIADGGAPVPPYPQPPVNNSSKIFIVDGGAPVPPLSTTTGHSSSRTFIADGSAPIPPYPQPPAANSSNILSYRYWSRIPIDSSFIVNRRQEPPHAGMILLRRFFRVTMRAGNLHIYGWEFPLVGMHYP